MNPTAGRASECRISLQQAVALRRRNIAVPPDRFAQMPLLAVRCELVYNAPCKSKPFAYVKRRKDMTVQEQVQEALDQVRPALQRDGGDVELVEVSDDGKVSVRLQGHCRGCPMAQMTLANLIERVIKERVEGIEQVVAVD
jgi:Fe-S cluster biogenesis protein NfuA